MRRFLFSCIIGLGLMSQSHAQTLGFSAQQQQTLDLVERYFQDLRTVSSEFIQVSSSGDYESGIVNLSRPDEKMRLVYTPPNQTEIIVRNDTIIYHDKEYSQVNYYPLSSTPLAALVQENLDFQKDVRVVDIATGAGVIKVTIVDPEDEAMGSVTLVFTDKPLSFRKWHVVDAQGIVTQVSLVNPKFNFALDDTVFDFTPPKGD